VPTHSNVLNWNQQMWSNFGTRERWYNDTNLSLKQKTFWNVPIQLDWRWYEIYILVSQALHSTTRGEIKFNGKNASRIRFCKYQLFLSNPFFRKSYKTMSSRDVRHSGPVIQARSIQAQGLNVATHGPEMSNKKKYFINDGVLSMSHSLTRLTHSDDH
jgi:hypothetical protein